MAETPEQIFKRTGKPAIFVPTSVEEVNRRVAFGIPWMRVGLFRAMRRLKRL